MRIRTAVLTVAVGMLAVWMLAGCGGSGDNEPDVPGETEQYLPLTVGNVWEYNYTEYDVAAAAKSARPARHSSRPYTGTKQLTSTDTVTVTGLSVIDDQEWYSVVYQYIGEPAFPAIYMRHNAAGLLRRSSATSQPFFVMKNPCEVGTTWTVSWLNGGVSFTSRLTVRSVDDTIATPAGTFTNCMQIEDVLALSGQENDVVTYWYAPNVGQVREEHHVGTTLVDQLELTAFTPATVGL
ncbi:MAG: hypothetical protein ACYC63_18740 [Armatimonadota bacterium]